MTKDNDLVIKILLVGESGIGKSCLILRFVEDQFTETFISTIGVDFKFKTIQLNNDENKMVKLQIWDTAGQERFRTITHNYYRGASGILVAFSITDEKSFNQVSHWIEDIKKNTNSDDNISIVLVGTKCDLEEKRVITIERAKNFADSLNLSYIETSSRTGEGVNKAFMTLIEEIIKKKKKIEQQKSTVDLTQKKTSSPCCN